MVSKQNWKWGYFCFFLLACLFVQIMGGLFTASTDSDRYPTLKKASWTPPPWVFGPVWTVLYIMIAIAGWLVYVSPFSKLRNKALILYWIQLGIKFLWSYLFFYLKSPALGFLDILLLLVLTGCAVFVFWRISRAASLLFIPYLIWTLSAATLNGATWILNKG